MCADIMIRAIRRISAPSRPTIGLTIGDRFANFYRKIPNPSALEKFFFFHR